MNQQLNELLQNIRQLNSYDLSSMLWSMNYATSAAAVNAIVRAMPDLPAEGAGVEAFTQYSNDVHHVDTSNACGFIALKKELNAIAESHADTDLPEIENTARFLAARIPTRHTYINMYNARKASGNAPRVSLRDFVNSEFTQALRIHTNLVTKLDDAVRLIGEIEESCNDIQVSEQFVDGLYERLIPKLNERWIKAELRATNIRASEESRLEARANLALLEEVIIFVGGTLPSYVADVSSDKDDEAFLAEAAKLDKLAA